MKLVLLDNLIEELRTNNNMLEISLIKLHNNKEVYLKVISEWLWVLLNLFL
jgi:hypothetical protein